MQGPGENAGAVDIGDGLVAVFKIESHNHPSFIEPYQGAATGVGGIIRDIFTMGARPIALLDALRFGTMDDATSRRVLKGVVAGIGGYGNSIGIPTVGGEVMFDESYRGNPLVNVFCLGIARRSEIVKGHASGVGNPVYYVGAKTGRDGIHGATMASATFDESSAEKRPAVQVGDPFMEKLLLEACLEVMRGEAVVGVQDMGAAGLTCATSETGSRGSVGVEIDVALVPQRETGMTPYEIMLSESQERMLLVAEKGREEEVFAVFRKWGLDAVTIGRVTDDGKLRVKNHGVVAAEIPNRQLADEAPLYDRPHNVAPYRSAPMEAPSFSSQDLTGDLLKLLASGDVCSKRWIWQQYDYTVRTNTIEGPGGDAAIVRIKETGTSVAMTLDGNGRYCSLAPREGARLIVAECCRNLSAVGALPVAATNNLNFGNPERPEIMAQMVEAIEGMGEACRHFETPITGGNVSLYNETLGEAIWPTPVVGMVGLLKTGAPMTVPFKDEGRTVMLVGGAGSCDLTRFGGTQYAKVVLDRMWGMPPALDLDYEKRVQAAIREIVNGGFAESAHDLSDGGLAVALAESSMNGIGAAIELSTDLMPEIALFHEGPSRVLVSTGVPREIERIARAHNVEALRIGVTMKEGLRIGNDSITWIDCGVQQLSEVWERALEACLTNFTTSAA
ncbi:MAG TPA: phosphoribosylformylglycinamidine synthase subunit PurL [Vicinamibacterales bacterium]